MKRALNFIGVVGVTVLITFLWITKNQSDARADRLEKALTDAEGRMAQLEGEIETGQQRIATLAKNQRSHANFVHDGSPAAVASQTDAGGTAADIPAPGNSTPQSGQAFGAPATFAVPINATAAAQYTGAGGESNWVTIQGTSSLRDWKVKATALHGVVRFEPGFSTAPGTAAAVGATNLSVSVSVSTKLLKSVDKNGNRFSSQMDEVMYEKLRAWEYPLITFTLSSLDSLEITDTAYRHLAFGTLSVAGVTNSVAMRLRIEPQQDGRIHLAGLAELKMSEFGIQPPGPSVAGISIFTGDAIRLSFSWWIKPSGNLQAER